MPSFNPQVPETNPENFLNWSRPISTVPVNKSTGIALEGIGNAITGGASLADQLVKETIRSDITQKVDKEKDNYTQALESVANGMGLPTGPTTNPSTGQQALDILPANTAQGQSIPSGITNGISRIQSLQNGVNNGYGGKINDTLYSANITSIAKQLRTQYPGYRDYIDSEVSKISGLPVANAYYKNLMQDINAGLTNQKAMMEKPINQLMSAAAAGVHIGNTSATDVLGLVQAGKVTPMQGLAWLNGVKSANFDFEQRAAARNDWKGSRETLAITSADDANKDAAAAASATFQAIKLSSGQTIGQVVDSARRGTLSLSDADAQKVGQVVQAQRDAYVQATLAKWNQSGLTQQLGGTEKALKIINDNASSFDNVINGIYKKDGGLATFHLEQNAARNADFKNGLLSDNELGPVAMNMKAISDQMGPNWATTALGTAIIANGIDQKFATYGSRKAVAAGSGNVGDIRFPPSFSADITDGQNKNIPSISGYYKSLAGLVSGITDPKIDDHTKTNLANYFFAPQNLGVLEKLQRDSGAGNTKIAGADSAFMNMTSPAVTKEMQRLGQSNPQLFINYRNWAQDSFNTLTRDDVTTLASVQQAGVQVHFNPNTHQFAISAGSASGSLAPATLGMARQAINRLNMRLYNLARVEDAEGGDVNEFLLQTLDQNGFRGEAGNTALPNIMAQEIMRNKLSPTQRINQGFSR